MTNVFIIHGAYGSPDENWFPWLKAELEKLGCTVYVPKFPTPENQSLKSWRKAFERYEKYLDSDSIIIGHSIGAAFILNVLENLENDGRKTDRKRVKAAFFVSGFIGKLDNPEFDELNKTFADKEFDWQKIRKNCGKFYIFHSDNDPYVPLAKAEELGMYLGVRPRIIKGAGHFNKASGYAEFEEILGIIKDEV
jgi:uncharacterized protein